MTELNTRDAPKPSKGWKPYSKEPTMLHKTVDLMPPPEQSDPLAWTEGDILSQAIVDPTPGWPRKWKVMQRKPDGRTRCAGIVYDQLWFSIADGLNAEHLTWHLDHGNYVEAVPLCCVLFPTFRIAAAALATTASVRSIPWEPAPQR